MKGGENTRFSEEMVVGVTETDNGVLDGVDSGAECWGVVECRSAVILVESVVRSTFTTPSRLLARPLPMGEGY